MSTRKQTARLAGLLYFAMGIPAAVSLTYFPSRFLVPSDPAATAANIAAATGLYRFLVLADMVSGVLMLCLAVTLYKLFRDVNRTFARLVVLCLIVQASMQFAVVMAQLAPLVLLNGARYWSAFTRNQLEALAQGFLVLRGQGVGAFSIYWGLWLLPLGLLTYKSGFLPRIIGIFVFIAGCTYVVSAVSFFLLPAYYRTIFWAAAPIYGLGELTFITYLMIKGVRGEPLEAAA
jgi:hypothetical protein